MKNSQHMPMLMRLFWNHNSVPRVFSTILRGESSGDEVDRTKLLGVYSKSNQSVTHKLKHFICDWIIINCVTFVVQINLPIEKHNQKGITRGQYSLGPVQMCMKQNV